MSFVLPLPLPFNFLHAINPPNSKLLMAALGRIPNWPVGESVTVKRLEGAGYRANAREGHAKVLEKTVPPRSGQPHAGMCRVEFQSYGKPKAWVFASACTRGWEEYDGASSSPTEEEAGGGLNSILVDPCPPNKFQPAT